MLDAGMFIKFCSLNDMMKCASHDLISGSLGATRFRACSVVIAPLPSSGQKMPTAQGESA